MIPCYDIMIYMLTFLSDTDVLDNLLICSKEYQRYTKQYILKRQIYLTFSYEHNAVVQWHVNITKNTVYAHYNSNIKYSNIQPLDNRVRENLHNEINKWMKHCTILTLNLFNSDQLPIFIPYGVKCLKLIIYNDTNIYNPNMIPKSVEELIFLGTNIPFESIPNFIKKLGFMDCTNNAYIHIIVPDNVIEITLTQENSDNFKTLMTPYIKRLNLGKFSLDFLNDIPDTVQQVYFDDDMPLWWDESQKTNTKYFFNLPNINNNH
jgi:hypothetical protein